MRPFQRLLKSLLPPISPEEAKRQARVIRPVYWVGLGLTAVVAAMQVARAPYDALPAIATLGVMALCYPLLRRRQERLVAALVLGASVCINFYSVWVQGGVVAPASRTYQLLVVAAGLVLGPQLVLPMTLIGIAAFGLALLGQAQGLIVSPVTLVSAQIHTWTAIGMLIATGVIVYFAAQELIRRARFSEGVIKAMPGVIVVFDLRQEGSPWSNRSLPAQLGWDPATLGDSPLRSLMHPEDLARLPSNLKRWNSAKDGEVLVTPFRMKHVSGEWRSFESRDTVYGRDKDSLPTQIISYIDDVTEKRRSDSERVQVQRLQALGQLAGGVAHDFNNLLAPIMGNAELIRLGLAADDERAHAATSILRSAERARELTRSMLGLGGHSSGERNRVDLNEVLRAYLPQLLRSLRQDLRVAFSPCDAPLLLLADPSQVERCLLNLALNAQDAMGGQGRLSISTRLEPAFAVLQVDDDGPGMSPDVRARAFEPFFTTKEPGQGTGLGLSSVHAVLQQHGGRIELDSEVGKGCHFRLYFPLQTPTVVPATRRWPGRVLLVDDEEDLREVLRRMLSSLGWQVLEAGTGDSALALAAAESGPIDLLLSDVRLPGLRGPDLGKQLKRLRPGLVSVYISGFADDVNVDGPLLEKPFSFEQLRDLLEQLQPKP